MEIMLISVSTGVYSIDLIQPDSKVVQPGQSLTITCQVSGYSLTDNSYATGWIRQREGKPMDWICHRWGGGDFYQNEALKNKFSYSRETSMIQAVTYFLFYCAIESYHCDYYFDYWGKGTMVTVTSGTQKAPTVFPLIECGSGIGDVITLGCLAAGFTPSSLTFTWNKKGVALTDFIQYPPIQKDSSYTGVSQIKVAKQEWDADQTYQCIATHFGTSVNKQNELPTQLRVLVSSDDENEVSFSCFAKDFSPKAFEIKWLKNEVELPAQQHTETFTSERKLDNGTTLYSAASFLSVNLNDLPHSTRITCEFQATGCDVKNATYTHSSCGCPKADVEITIEGPAMKDILLKKEGTIICKVNINNPSVQSLHWENEKGEELEALEKTANGKLWTISHVVTYDEWSKGLVRYCVVGHTNFYEPLKERYERKAGAPTQRPSVFMLPPVEHTKTNTVTLTCFVKDFFPQEVYVSWLVDDEAAASTYKVSTTNPVKDNGSYSVYGQITVDIDEWKNDNLVYNCAVYHESVVNNTKAIVRSIGHRSFDKTNMVNLNMNIPETCKAH
uniref:Ig-like domain-containing protein n=1 Tax=Echeneis naucrates TaxID=173247 RepID=A0A665UQJ4_ECHNA